MTDDYNLPEIAASLASSLRRLRDAWIIAFYQSLCDFQLIREEYKLSTEEASPVVSAFQIVHVMSIIQVKKYIREEQVGDFIAPLIESLYGHPTDDWMKYVNKYETNMKLDILEQLSRLSEDVAIAIMKSDHGMIIGPCFTLSANDFLFRNWGVVADHFGDLVMSEECLKAVKKIHTKNNI